MASSEYEKRQNILQGLQRTKSRLEKLQREASPSPRGSPINISPVNIGPVERMHIPTSRPSPPQPPTAVASGTYYNKREQQRVALEHAQSQAYGYVIPQDSDYNNFILPVLPRFNAQGELKQPHITSK